MKTVRSCTSIPTDPEMPLWLVKLRPKPRASAESFSMIVAAASFSEVERHAVTDYPKHLADIQALTVTADRFVVLRVQTKQEAKSCPTN